MNHEYFKDKISAYHDGELKHEEERMIAEHLAECEECRKLLDDLEKLDQMISERSGLSDSAYWEESAQRIEAALGSESETKVVDVRQGSYRGLWWKIGALAASAAVIVVIAVYQGDISKKIMNGAQKTTLPSIPAPRSGDEIDTSLSNHLPVNRGEVAKPLQQKALNSQLALKDTGKANARLLDETPAEEKQARPLAGKVTLPSAKPLESDEIKLKKIPLVAKSGGNTAKTESAPALAAPNVERAPTKLQKPGAEIQSFVTGLAQSRTLDQWRAERDSLEEVVAHRQQLAEQNSLASKGKARPKSLAESQQDPELNLIESYYNIASLTSDSLEYRASVDSLKALAGSKEGLYKQRVGECLHKLEEARKNIDSKSSGEQNQ